MTAARRTAPIRTSRTTPCAAVAGVRAPRVRRPHDGTAPPVDHRPLVRVRVAGDLDLGTAPRLAERVLDLVRCGACVAVDTSAVAFVDCCGLAALEQCVAQGRGAVTLEPVGGSVARLRGLVALADAPSRPDR